MKQAFPFEPLWEAKVAGVTHQGKGLLAPELWKQIDQLEEFSVVLPDGRITAIPKMGVICGEHYRMADLGGPAALVWSRRMQALIATHDHNTTLAPECLWYEFGLKNGSEVVCRVMPDLKVIWPHL